MAEVPNPMELDHDDEFAVARRLAGEIMHTLEEDERVRFLISYNLSADVLKELLDYNSHTEKIICDALEYQEFIREYVAEHLSDVAAFRILRGNQTLKTQYDGAWPTLPGDRPSLARLQYLREKPLLTLSETVELTGLKRGSIDRWRQEGIISEVRVGPVNGGVRIVTQSIFDALNDRGARNVDIQEARQRWEELRGDRQRIHAVNAARKRWAGRDTTESEESPHESLAATG